jgi:hypothetical protein
MAGFEVTTEDNNSLSAIQSEHQTHGFTLSDCSRLHFAPPTKKVQERNQIESSEY